MLLICDDYGRAGFREEFNDFKPIVKVSIFLAIVGNEEVEGAFGEEKLVGGVVDFLAAEVPEVDAKGVAAGVGEVEAKYVDAFGGFFGGGGAFEFEGVVGVDQFVGKAGFSGSAFADNKEFGFIDIVISFFLTLPKEFQN